MAHINNTEVREGVQQAEHDHNIGPWQVLVESNFLNFLVLAIIIVYLGNKYLPQVIENRKKQISKELEHAKEAKMKAAQELEKIKEKSKLLTGEIEDIKKEATKTASAIKKSIEEETEKEIETLKAKLKKEIVTLQDEAIQNIQKEASNAAIKMAEETLKNLAKNENIQNKLIEDFIGELNKTSRN